jgi:polyisoprenoid-binding protein YceI
MKTLPYAFAILLVVSAPLMRGRAQELQRPIDTHHSSAQFSVSHVFVERVSGTVPIAGGTVALTQGSTMPISVSAVLDASGIKTSDDDRDQALRGPDWFDVKRFPTWSFVSKKITPNGKNGFSIDGTLTIHGVAAPLHLEVTVDGNVGHPAYHAVGHVDRHAFGMTVTRLDPAIGSDVEITLLVQLE